MKKSYLMIAAAAALFAACSSNDTFKNIETQESAITFNQAISKTTRAAIYGSTDALTLKALADEGGFVVYGYKTLDNWSTIAQDLFTVSGQGTRVQSGDNGSTWYYSPLRFWDKNGKYNFYAVAPYGPSDGATYSINIASITDSENADYSSTSPLNNKKFGFISITGAKSAKYTNSDDYLVARGGAENQLGSNHVSNNTTVDFEFHHVMAKVDFKLKSTLTSGTIVVSGLKMVGWDNATSNFVQKTANTPNQLDKEEWTLGNTVVVTTNDAIATLIPSSTNNQETSISLTCGGDAMSLSDWYIMVPQSIQANSLKFYVTYSYTSTDGNYSETFTNQEATLTSAQTWGTDSHTTYTLDIKPNAITFDVTSVCGFCVSSTPADIEVK